jgi:beta-glucosidase/6-phospho-beta-glucosidase/beta-galactosidase
MGIPFVRYGIPFHVVARDAGRFDWDWTDRALDVLREEGIAPIVDLLHFGVPDDIAGVGDPRLVGRYVPFVEAFVERYPWVRWFTPVNEPYITALFSGRRGYWNERGTDDASFVRALDTVLECGVRGAAVIRSAVEDAVIVQSDACDGYRAATPDAEPLAQRLGEEVFLGFDLTLGHAPSDPMLGWLASHGIGDRRVAWFMDHAVEAPFIVGLDYYQGNERIVARDGQVRSDPRPAGFGAMARRWLDRYGLPVMLAETNMVSERAVAWLDECWSDAMAIREEGGDLVGFCWYSLTDQIDWDIALREFRGKVNSLGLVDLARHPRPVAARYAELAGLAVRGELPRIARPAAAVA